MESDSSKLKRMPQQKAVALIQSDAVYKEPCMGCGGSLARSWSIRPLSDGFATLLCLDCGYAFDVKEFKETGIFCGSLASHAMTRRDWPIFRQFLELESLAAPVFTAIWAKYELHPALNHATLKQRLQIDLSTGVEHERAWSEPKPHAEIADGSWVLEVSDAMCGYRGLHLCRKNDPSGMWIEGKVRPGNHQRGWYSACHADRAFVKEALGNAKRHLGLPHGYVRDTEMQLIHPPVGLFGTIHADADLDERAWEHATANVRRHLMDSYGFEARLGGEAMADMLFLAQGMGVSVSRGDIASAFVKRDELEGRLRVAGFDAKSVIDDLAGRCFATSRSLKNPRKD